MDRTPGDIAGFQEPACWGSAELPLVPPSLVRVLAGLNLSGLIKTGAKHVKRPVTIPVTTFASMAWRATVGDVRPVDRDSTLLDMILDAVSLRYEEDPDRFDVPVLSTPLDRFDGAGNLPFATETWQVLAEIGAANDVDIAVLLMGTFREMMEQLGSARASLDLAITGEAWIGPNKHGSFGFITPRLPDSLEQAQRFVRLRGFRCRGLIVSGSYTPEFADVMGRRWAIGSCEPWTLDRCGQAVSLTRERVRQIEKKAMWDNPVRCWGRPESLEDACRQLVDGGTGDVIIKSTGETWSRAEAVALLVEYGYPAGDLEEPTTIESELREIGVHPYEVRQYAYQETERVGFVTAVELRHHLLDKFPQIDEEFVGEVMSWLAVMDDLPYGYVYLEGSRGSRLKLVLERVLATLGPLQFDEAYEATKRGLRQRESRHVVPPRRVVEEFVHRSEDFWLEDGVVGLVNPVVHELGEVEKWVHDTIMECTGQVIHRTELWDKARGIGVKNGTLNVYSSYSGYFKSVGRGCITVTGLSPSELMIDLASKRALAIRVRTKRGKPVIKAGTVSLEVQAGNDLLDAGTLNGNVELRKLLGGRRYKVFGESQQYGHVIWSGSVLAGFSTVLQALKVQPGDTIMLTFSLKDSEVVVELGALDEV